MRRLEWERDAANAEVVATLDRLQAAHEQRDGITAAVVKFLKRLREEGMTAPYDLDDALAKYGGAT